MKKIKFHVLWFLLCVILFSGCSSSDQVEQEIPNTPEQVQQEPDLVDTTKKENEISKSSLFHIYFIDVGQGDASLLELNGHYMLIDAGDNQAEQTMVDFLTQKGIEKLDYVVGTHPHADHIGGLDAVLDTFPVDEIYMPKISANTKTFEDVLDAIERQNLQVTTPIAGSSFPFSDANVEILAPMENYGDLNNHSILLRITYQDHAFLFTGDLEAEAETDVLNSGAKLDAQLLKVGHHGSNTSTSEAFLEKINPSYAVISVGANNSYGHPTQTIINRLNNKGIQIYRTDLNGTIHVISDGKHLSIDNKMIETDKVSDNSEINQENENTANVTEENKNGLHYIGNKNSKKFHKNNCSTLPSEKNRVEFETREDAISAGYSPCKNCNP